MARNYRFKAEFTSSLGQYGRSVFNAPDYASAYARAWREIEGKPKWAIAAVAPVSEDIEPPLGDTYHAVMRTLEGKGAFRYRANPQKSGIAKQQRRGILNPVESVGGRSPSRFDLGDHVRTFSGTRGVVIGLAEYRWGWEYRILPDGSKKTIYRKEGELRQA